MVGWMPPDQASRDERLKGSSASSCWSKNQLVSRIGFPVQFLYPCNMAYDSVVMLDPGKQLMIGEVGSVATYNQDWADSKSTKSNLQNFLMEKIMTSPV